MADIYSLPETERNAFNRIGVDSDLLPAGAYDDTAHRVFAETSPSRRRRAEYKASIARMLVSLRKRGIKEGERFALVREHFGSKGTSLPL
ncbi:hypothetical protein [Celeribacter indicus]|uniref:hypothetical protein n=1 Tax=Celeribacter indicus TaxID=1208324 RepID=UPI0011149D2B|nr:hypothetical protein [Celeribacter indicus]